MRRPVKNRNIRQPDLKYSSLEISTLVNYVMFSGKKTVAEAALAAVNANAANVARLGALTEKAFQSQVVSLAHILGYRVYHPWISIRSERGWPDLALFKPGRFLLIELKTDEFTCIKQH